MASSSDAIAVRPKARRTGERATAAANSSPQVGSPRYASASAEQNRTSGCWLSRPFFKAELLIVTQGLQPQGGRHRSRRIEQIVGQPLAIRAMILALADRQVEHLGIGGIRDEPDDAQETRRIEPILRRHAQSE